MNLFGKDIQINFQNLNKSKREKLMDIDEKKFELQRYFRKFNNKLRCIGYPIFNESSNSISYHEYTELAKSVHFNTKVSVHVSETKEVLNKFRNFLNYLIQYSQERELPKFEYTRTKERESLFKTTIWNGSSIAKKIWNLIKAVCFLDENTDSERDAFIELFKQAEHDLEIFSKLLSNYGVQLNRNYSMENIISEGYIVPKKRFDNKFDLPSIRTVTKMNEDNSKNNNEANPENIYLKNNFTSPLSCTSYAGNSPSSPKSFILYYAEKSGLSLEFSEVAVKNTSFMQEYIMACRLHTIGAEGKAKSKNTAKEIASSQILRLVLTKQAKGCLPAVMLPLDAEERELALALTCQYIDYELILGNLLTKLNAVKVPQFAQIFNVSKGQHSFRCKAMGFNGVGVGKTKEIARRMGAKSVLEQIEQERERNFIKKYGEKRGKRMLKQCGSIYYT